jgi:hypothetical protein
MAHHPHGVDNVNADKDDEARPSSRITSDRDSRRRSSAFSARSSMKAFLDHHGNQRTSKRRGSGNLQLASDPAFAAEVNRMRAWLAEEKKHRAEATKHLISPNNRFIYVWDSLTVLALAFTAFVTPFEVRTARHRPSRTTSLASSQLISASSQLTSAPSVSVGLHHRSRS